MLSTNVLRARCRNVAVTENLHRPCEQLGFDGRSPFELRYDGVIARIEKMIIASVLFLAFVVATGVTIVKVYEWRQDVLYGPYLKRAD
jgi:hypothetical protein